MTILTSRSDRPVADEHPSVSINHHVLAYDRAAAIGRNGRPAFGFRRRSAMAAMVVLIMALVVAVVTAVGSRRPAAGAEPEAKVTSAQFDMAEGESQGGDPLSPAGRSQSVSYRTLMVQHRGQEIAVDPLPGTVGVIIDQGQAVHMAADLGGLRVGSAAPEFADSLADAVSSNGLHRLVRFTPSDPAASISIDVSYPRPLLGRDYLLVQELNGDAALQLTALDAQGAPIGTTVVVGPNYQWNTGHAPDIDQTLWATAIPVERFAVGGQQVAAVRISGGDTQFKVVALEVSPDQSLGQTGGEAAGQAADGVLTPTAAASVADPSTGPGFAAIALESALQPAIAVDGAGCDGAADIAGTIDSAATTIGQAATYCFTVTNVGTTGLAELTVSDPALGLVDAALPRASGPEVLEPGQRAVLYHHSVVPDRSAGNTAIVRAVPVDEQGTAIDGLAAPSDGGSEATLPAPEEALLDDGSMIAAGQGQLATDQPPPILANTVEEPSAAPAADPTPVTPAAQSDAAPEEAAVEPVTQLALTGMVTEPWVMVIFAMAFIFIGYTAYAAFQQRAEGDESQGHDQLDALGFD